MAEVIFDSPNYARVGRWLEEYGSKELRSTMAKAITAAAQPIVPKLRASVTAGRTDTKVRTSGGAKARAGQALSKSKAYDNAKANEQFTGAKGKRKTAAIERRALTGKTKVDVGGDKARVMAATSLRASIAKGVRIENRSSGKRAGVRVLSRTSALPADQKYLPRHMNRGKWRHPVFGNRDVWVEQTFTPGWFNKPIQEHRPAVREAIEAELAEWLELAAFLMEKAAKQ